MSIIQIPAGRAVLSGNLTIPENAAALVLFAHGSGSSRHSPRNQFVARTLNRSGLGTLLFDLFTPDEEALDLCTRVNTDSTSVYRLSALCTRPIGPGKKTKHAICASDISAQAQAALRHWSPPSTFHAKSQ